MNAAGYLQYNQKWFKVETTSGFMNVLATILTHAVFEGVCRGF